MRRPVQAKRRAYAPPCVGWCCAYPTHSVKWGAFGELTRIGLYSGCRRHYCVVLWMPHLSLHFSLKSQLKSIKNQIALNSFFPPKSPQCQNKCFKFYPCAYWYYSFRPPDIMLSARRAFTFLITAVRKLRLME